MQVGSSGLEHHATPRSTEAASVLSRKYLYMKLRISGQGVIAILAIPIGSACGLIHGEHELTADALAAQLLRREEVLQVAHVAQTSSAAIGNPIARQAVRAPMKACR